MIRHGCAQGAHCAWDTPSRRQGQEPAVCQCRKNWTSRCCESAACRHLGVNKQWLKVNLKIAITYFFVHVSVNHLRSVV